MYNLEKNWALALANELEKPYFQKLRLFLETEKLAQKAIFPPEDLVFSAFNKVPLSEVKVVILGQDPYHGAGQAMGLSFSVADGVKVPPSLKNIYKELQTDLNIAPSKSGNLNNWANQGVFLLNAALTVESGKANSHQKIGWLTFTDAVISLISAQCDGVVFMLWGNFAKAKNELIDAQKHCVLEAAHPSPLAGGAFFGSQHFSKANEYLVSKGKTAIDWTHA
jgi:uracil-DNA glycosylase